MESTFALHGFAVCVDAGTQATSSRAAAVLLHFGAHPAPAPPGSPLAITLRVAAPPPVDGPLVATHLDLRVHRGAAGTWIVGPASTTRVTPDGSASETWLAADDAPLHVLTYVLSNQLRAQGAWVLHAACLARPDGSGVLLVGPSGAGKSTLAATLLSRGFALLSDDSVLLRPPEVLALRRGVFLEPGPAAAHFPEWSGRFAATPLVEATKHQLDPEVLAGRCLERCRAAALWLPQVADADATTIEAVPPSEALFVLARESRLAELDPAGAPAHLAALGALAGSVRAARLHLGRDVLRAPDAVADRLRPLVEAP